MEKFKCEVFWCTEEKGNHKTGPIFGVDETNVRPWWKHKAVISESDMSQKKFIQPKKGQFPETDDAVFTFFQERCETGINCIILFLQDI
jgi:hypothetical protein